MDLDWGDGDYSLTAVHLEPVARRALDVARIAANEKLLDLGCGNGNVAIEAARRGANVTAVDPSARLLSAARSRANASGVVARFLHGEGARVPVPDDTFDAVVAVFSIIFAPDPNACVEEMLRVTRPGGRLVITSWRPTGAINTLSELIRPREASWADSPWPEAATIRELFAHYPVKLSFSEEGVPFESSSATTWFDSLEKSHPFWRLMKEQRAAEWTKLRAQSVNHLEAANESSEAFCCTSQYLITRVDLADGEPENWQD